MWGDGVDEEERGGGVRGKEVGEEEEEGGKEGVGDEEQGRGGMG